MAQTVSEVIHKALGVLAFMHMFLVLVLASRGVTAVSMESVSTPVTSSKCKTATRPSRNRNESSDNITDNLSFSYSYLSRSLHGNKSLHWPTDSIHKQHPILQLEVSANPEPAEPSICSLTLPNQPYLCGITSF